MSTNPKINLRSVVAFADVRLPMKFWKRVRPNADGCWIWTGANYKGYGRFSLGDRRLGIPHRTQGTHRLAYEALVGPVAGDLEVDHLCRVPACCNPAHLEPVTTRVNQLRAPGSLAAVNVTKTHCPAGHPYSDENTLAVSGRRQCRTCNRARSKAWRDAQPTSVLTAKRMTNRRKTHG